MISVIIPTCNRYSDLSKCLVQLTCSGSQLHQDAYEIIVTDDSKNDESKLLISQKFPLVKWTRGPCKGPAANRNHGARQSTGNWLLFIDDDCLPSPGILKNYLRAVLQYPHLAVFEGCVKAERAQRSLAEEAPINETGNCLWSCNFMISKMVFLTVLKGFDEKFPYAAMEDVDLHYRLKKLGIRTLFLPDATVVHPWRLQQHMFSITIKRFKSTRYYLQKHPEKKQEINTRYFIRAFYNAFFKNTLSRAVSFRCKGIFPKITYDFMQLYFAILVLRDK